MIVYPNIESRQYFEEVAEFAKKHNLWVAMPETTAGMNKLTPKDENNRHNNLNTQLEYLATYGEHWSTRKTTTETYDGQTGDNNVKVEERKWQSTFTRCLLTKDSCRSFMGFEFLIEHWDRDGTVERPPSEREYKLRTFISPEGVKEIIDDWLPGSDATMAEHYEWRDLDYWLKYGCRWEELPGNDGMDHWTRGHNGGLIFNGPQHPCDGSAPQYTVSLDTNTTPGWGIHT